MSGKTLSNIFKQYTSTDSEDIPGFSKIHVAVSLSDYGDEHYLSRSQAKRILLGLEKFNHVVLDFKKVKTVGEGFVDEVFRVFREKHPHIRIDYINANDEVKFMIEGGLTL